MSFEIPIINLDEEITFEVFMYYTSPLEYFSLWCRKDYLLGEALLVDGTVVLFGYYLCGDKKVCYLLDTNLVPLAKECGFTGKMLHLSNYYPANKGKFGKSSWSMPAYKNYSHKNRRPHTKNRALCALKYRGKKLSAYTESDFLQTDSCIECAITGVIHSTKTKVHLEHLMPLSVVGAFPFGNSSSNCYYLLGSLNNSKSNKNVFEWIDSMDQQHLNFLLRNSDCTLSIEQFKENFFTVINSLAFQASMTFSEYKNLYNKEFQL